MQKARLENWELCSMPNGYRLDRVVRGDVYGHPRFEDGTKVITSYVVDADLRARWVQSANTLYTLGEPHPTYVAWMKEHAPDQAEEYGITPSAINPVSNSQPNSES